MVFEEAVFLIVMMILAFLFVGVFLNESFWQGYRNTKFLDEMKKEKKDWSSIEHNLIKSKLKE